MPRRSGPPTEVPSRSPCCRLTRIPNRTSTRRSGASLRTARLTVGARLPAFDADLATLLSLKPGEVLSTGLPRTSELELFVAGQRRYVAAPGRQRRNLAVRVLDTIPTEPEDLILPGRDLQI